MPRSDRPRPVLGLVFLTVFLDMVGFSVLFPLFPAMLEHYLEREGEASAVGRLVALLAGWVGEPGTEGARWAVTVFFGGILGSLYSLLQFLFAPVWGGLSDRIGRRPTLLVTLAGTALSHLVWFFAGSFPLLVLSRVIGGVMAGNISTASAVVADTQSGPLRARGMGILGAGIGLGFVVGPAIGGVMAQWDPLATWPGGERLGINPFSAAALAAFVLAALNLLWALTRFPETLPAQARGSGRGHEGRTLQPLAALRRIDQPGVRSANLAYLLYFGAFAAMEFTLTFLAHERLGFGPGENAWMFVYVGLVIALVQGGVVRRLAPRLGERRLASAGMLLTLPGFLAVGATQSAGLLYVGLTFLSVGSALVMPSLSALVSRYSPPERQGFALGVFRSLGSLARAVGPLLGAGLYWILGSGAPYLAAAAVALVPLGLALRLPPPPDEAREAPGSARAAGGPIDSGP